MSFNIRDTTTNITWWQVQNYNINSAAFAMITIWGFSTSYKAIQSYRSKPKPIYALNATQSVLMLFKSIITLIYTVFLGLDCTPRSFLINLPLVFSLDAMYAILLIKLLMFTPFRWTSRGIFVVGLLVHASLNFIGVAMRSTRQTAGGICRDTYPILFKQQYVVEAILECYTALALIHGIAIKARASGSIISATTTVLRQLRQNENMRVFSCLIVIALKLTLTYNSVSINFDYAFMTHALDQMRSAIICWALMRDYRRVTKPSSASKHGANHSSGNAIGSKNASSGHPERLGTIQRGTSNVSTHSVGGYASGVSGRIVTSKPVNKHDPIYEDDVGENDGRVSVGKRNGGVPTSHVYGSTQNQNGVLDMDGPLKPDTDIEAGRIGSNPLDLVKSTETIAAGEIAASQPDLANE